MDKDRDTPKSASVSGRGIKTSKDFVDFFGALMDDLVTYRLDAETGRAACLAGKIMLDVVKMQREYSHSEPMPLNPSPSIKQSRLSDRLPSRDMGYPEGEH